MPRVSFTLRRGLVTDTDPEDLGSALRYDDTEEYISAGQGGSATVVGASARIAVSDSALRSDGIVTPPSIFVQEAFFEGRSSCYGEVDLRWAVNRTVPTSADMVPYAVSVVYSPEGPPITVSSGITLVDSTTANSAPPHTGLPEGKWAYYSLFVEYRNNLGDITYERSASLSILVPRNYGSTETLWQRVPAYYRLQDELQGYETSYDSQGDKVLSPRYVPSCVAVPSGTAVGPLYKYLSIIGFDMDYIKTLIEYVNVSHDPRRANDEALDAIAEELGVPLRVGDLGAGRLRTVLDTIGVYRRSKGTLMSLEYLLQGLLGSIVSIDAEAKTIVLYSQRVNYITSPKDGNGLVDWRVADETEVESPDPFSTALGQANFTYASEVFTRTGGTLDHIMIRLDSPVPIKQSGTDSVAFSVSSGQGTDRIVWARLVDGSENVVGMASAPVQVAGVPTFVIPATDNLTGGDGYLSTYVEFLVEMPAVGSTFGLSRILAERNFRGPYFDGDEQRGGWLVDTQSISDYRWKGTPNASVSIYAEDYERTKQMIDVLLPSLLPITQDAQYDVTVYNGVPGID